MHHMPGRLLVGALLLALLPHLAVSLVAPTASASTWSAQASPGAAHDRTHDRFETRVLRQVNKRRVRAGLPRIVLFESCLDGLAAKWSRRLSRTGRLEHRDQSSVLLRCHHRWVGENLARGSSASPRSIVRAWWRSPSHRAVMMKPRADRVGLSMTRRDGGLVVVLNLGDAG